MMVYEYFWIFQQKEEKARLFNVEEYMKFLVVNVKNPDFEEFVRKCAKPVFGYIIDKDEIKKSTVLHDFKMAEGYDAVVAIIPWRIDSLRYRHGTGKGLTFQTLYMGDLTVIGGSSGRTNIAATIMKDIINACKV